MAEKATIARPYARAAFEHARQHGAFDRWSQMLASASTVVGDGRVAKLLTNPKVKSSDLVGLIADVAGDALDEHSRNFLAMLADNRRLGLLPEIAAMFEAPARCGSDWIAKCGCIARSIPRSSAARSCARAISSSTARSRRVWSGSRAQWLTEEVNSD
jgi:ATP synthase delta (OSCP) subunit